MIPKASNSNRISREKQIADKLSTLLDSASLSMPLISHHILMLPANEQMQFIDLIMAYISEAANSTNPQIAFWANSISIT